MPKTTNYFMSFVIYSKYNLSSKEACTERQKHILTTQLIVTTTNIYKTISCNWFQTPNTIYQAKSFTLNTQRHDLFKFFLTQIQWILTDKTSSSQLRYDYTGQRCGSWEKKISQIATNSTSKKKKSMIIWNDLIWVDRDNIK